ncbi:MAG: hydrogenase maturation nickel metallochaperone HypA, partial [Bacteroidales bacterium]|nr:hydrogenase maturation nickel metallochaperone HypA [Bacteroidales bacterium]
TTNFRINRIEPLSECLSCHLLFAPESIFGKCPECSETNIKLIRGNELQVKSLLVEQNQ